LEWDTPVLVFVNANPGCSAARKLEVRLIDALAPAEMEVYHQLRHFVFRVKERIYDIRLVAVCIPDKEMLTLLEQVREDLCGLPLLFIAGDAAIAEGKRLYAFYPRIVLRMQQDDTACIEFIQTKMAAAAGGDQGERKPLKR